MPTKSPTVALGIQYRPTDTPLIESIQSAIDRFNQFTATLVKTRVRKLYDIDLALVFFRTTNLAYATLVSPTTGGTTGQRKGRFYDCVKLDIETASLKRIISSSFYDEFDKLNFESARRPSPGLWDAMWNAIKELRPDLISELDRLQKRREQKQFDFDINGAEVLFQARDAIGTALEAANIGKRGIFSKFSDLVYQQETSGVAKLSLSDGLAGGLTEDVVIHHDARILPGFFLSENEIDSFRFERGRHVLDIVIGNRRPLETATGADLLYYNHMYNAFTFIQYKMMKKENSGWVFRPDEQTSSEFCRMVQCQKIFKKAGAKWQDPNAFRLSNDPFFFKFVKRDRLEMDSDELTRGMYISLMHYDALVKNSKGPKGGTILSFDSAGRWLCKTSFVDLLRDGWIGTRNISQENLTELVQNGLEQGRVVISAQTSNSDVQDHPV